MIRQLSKQLERRVSGVVRPFSEDQQGLTATRHSEAAQPEVLPDEWKRIDNPGGDSYYWNVKTMVRTPAPSPADRN
eukprot:3273231-Prymnesium_polylepis.1